jgi:hypothetical protein
MSLETIETEAARLLALCSELRAENERMKKTLSRAAMTEIADPEQELLFQQLVGIVAQEFGVCPQMVASRLNRKGITPARHLVAAIWSETRTLDETAARCRYSSPVSVMYARGRVQRMMEEPQWQGKIQNVIDRVRQEMPWLLNEEPVEPENTENTNE